MIYSTKDYCVKCGKMADACTCKPNEAVPGWRCKKCKGSFETMAAMKYHECEPVKFHRPQRCARRSGPDYPKLKGTI